MISNTKRNNDYAEEESSRVRIDIQKVDDQGDDDDEEMLTADLDHIDDDKRASMRQSM